MIIDKNKVSNYNKIGINIFKTTFSFFKKKRLKPSKEIAIKCFSTFIAITSIGDHGLSSEIAPQKFKVNQNYHGFDLIQTKKIPDIDVHALLFSHKQSGARLLKLQSEDNNKTFCINFKTLPHDSTGVAHILEHSVLNGSKKFPIKSPFDELAKGSLNTFLNAMTASDHTSYPVASLNHKDFRNLMDVYLDAVFFPKIYEEPNIFRQEGWRYDINSKNDPIKYNGVVYNEMKGAFSSSPLYYLLKGIGTSLFPDNTYGNSSGGFPSNIPELSYKEFLSFHQKFYHPRNSYILIYGDSDTEEDLKLLNDEYLSKFNKKDAEEAILPIQKVPLNIKNQTIDYPISSTIDDKNKTQYGIAFVVGEETNAETSIAFQVIADALLNTPGSQLRKALLDAKIGKDMYATYWQRKQSIFMIIVENALPKKEKELEKIVNETLTNLVNNGLDKKIVEGSLNQIEFRLREANYGGYPKGLVYNNMILNNWLFANDPISPLEYEKSLTAIKKAIKNNYLENLIKTFLVKNKHSVLVTANPKKNLQIEAEKEIEKSLTKFKASLSNDELEKIIKDNESLKEFQKREDTKEALSSIPLLSLSEIEKKAQSYSITKKSIEDIEVLHYPHFSNGIMYLRMLFDARGIPQELIQYVPLLTSVMGELGTESYSYADLDTELNIYTGGISFDLVNYIKNDNNKVIYPKVVVYSKAFTSNFGKLLSLQTEVLTTTKFDDKKRLYDVLKMLHSRLQSNVQRNAMSFTQIRLSSQLSPAGAYNELVDGLSYVDFIKDLTENFDKKADKIILTLKKVASILFTKPNLTLGTTCDEKDYPNIKKYLPHLVKQLPNNKSKITEYKIPISSKDQGLASASPVQYVLKGGNFRDNGFEYSGKLRVLSQILSREYLQNKVRKEGGAYGAWTIFSRTGTAYFGSYRDPNLKMTLDHYHDAISYLKNFKATEREMTRYIIGTISKLDHPMSVVNQGDYAMDNHIRERSFADIQKERTEVLQTSANDIKKYASLIKELLDKGTICVFGNEKKLEENKKLFKAITPVNN